MRQRRKNLSPDQRYAIADRKKRLLRTIRVRCYRGLETPAIKKLATKTGIPEQMCSELVRELEAEGLLRIIRQNQAGVIKTFGVKIRGEWKHTKQRQYYQTRIALKHVEEYGGTEIAAIKNRVKAEKLIAEIYRKVGMGYNGARL